MKITITNYGTINNIDIGRLKTFLNQMFITDFIVSVDYNKVVFECGI